MKKALLVGSLALLVFASLSQAALVMDLTPSNYDPATGVWTNAVGDGNNAVAQPNCPASGYISGGVTVPQTTIKPTAGTIGTTPTVDFAPWSGTWTNVGAITLTGSNLKFNSNVGQTNGGHTETIIIYGKFDAGTAGGTDGGNPRLTPILASSDAWCGITTTGVFGMQNSNGTYQYAAAPINDGNLHMITMVETVGQPVAVTIDGVAQTSLNFVVQGRGWDYAPWGSAYRGIVGLSGAQDGNNDFFGSSTFSGSIAGLKIYDTTLSSSDIAAVTASMTNVPEPMTMALLVIGGMGVLARRRAAK